MSVERVKTALNFIQYDVTGDTLEELLESLRATYPLQKVGSSIAKLGFAAPLYLKSNNVAFLVDNTEDLRLACESILTDMHNQGMHLEGVIALAPDKRSRYISDITNCIGYEITNQLKTSRDLSWMKETYGQAHSNVGKTILDDLLTGNKTKQEQATKALRQLLIYA